MLSDIPPEVNFVNVMNIARDVDKKSLREDFRLKQAKEKRNNPDILRIMFTKFTTFTVGLNTIKNK